MIFPQKWNEAAKLIIKGVLSTMLKQKWKKSFRQKCVGSRDSFIMTPTFYFSVSCRTTKIQFCDLCSDYKLCLFALLQNKMGKIHRHFSNNVNMTLFLQKHPAVQTSIKSCKNRPNSNFALTRKNNSMEYISRFFLKILYLFYGQFHWNVQNFCQKSQVSHACSFVSVCSFLTDFQAVFPLIITVRNENRGAPRTIKNAGSIVLFICKPDLGSINVVAIFDFFLTSLLNCVKPSLKWHFLQQCF